MTTTWERTLAAGGERVLGRPLSLPELGKFAKYLDLLLQWQRVHRLMGSSDPVWIAENLFVDSLRFVRVMPERARRILDLGSGAGFPGVPMAVVRPDLDLTLLEARQRRASFLSTVVRELTLHAGVRTERAEHALESLAGEFDAVVMRCAGPVDDVIPVALQFVRAGGVVVASGPPRPVPVRAGRWVVDADGRRFLVAGR